MPNSTIQLMMLFHSKVQIGCVFISLLSRVHIAESHHGSSGAMVSDKLSSANHGAASQRMSRLGVPGALESGVSLVRTDEMARVR